jgi:AAA domain
VSFLQEIHSWSRNLAAWQQDAIARLYANRTLIQADKDDLFALAKAEHGIEDPEGRQPNKLADAQVAAPSVPNRLVQIAAIKQLCNVNALAEGQRLPIAPTGLTIIYGENGAGKSGYSRVLKQACRARDQRESILPDAKKAPGKVGPAQAVFEVVVDGRPIDLTWNHGRPAPEQLSEIAIFDTHCARAYIDNQGDFAYVPYGLDILGSLVAVCNEIRSRVTQEKAANAPNATMFAPLAKTDTQVGKLMADLLGKAKAEEVAALAGMSQADVERLATLNKALAEADPKQKAQVLRLRGTRFKSLTTRIEAALGTVSDAKLAELRRMVDASNTAKNAAELAALEFKQIPGLLPGTGGEEWKALFEAARNYAATSHAGHAFPNLPADSTCPLCQNPLGDGGASRLISFDAFVKQAAEKAARDVKASAVAAYQAIETAKLDLGIDEALSRELTDSDSNLAAACSRLQTVLSERQASALKASTGQLDWGEIVALPDDPRGLLGAAAIKLQTDAKALEDSMDEKAKAGMISEQAELDARRRLGELEAAALEAIAKRELCSKLQACIDSMVTTGISRKSTDLSKTMATHEVANALNTELKALNVHELQVVMKPESPGGKTQFKLALQLPSGSTPSAILSEGEQRAIAIGSFLAEVKLGKGRGGIVFDDPVSSLDHRRRWHVASRLVEEAKQRQVIIFTHDIYFLCIVQQEADLAGLSAATQCIGKGPAGFGVQADRLPFDALSTSKRVKELRLLQENIGRVHKTGDEAETTRLTREAYSHLRMAWERGVEEVLFQGVVTRFIEGVSTQKLKYVIVEDSDYETINAGMTRSSKFSGHDPASSAQLPTLHPEDLKADIEKLETWRASVEVRKAKVEARRK